MRLVVIYSGEFNIQKVDIQACKDTWPFQTCVIIDWTKVDSNNIAKSRMIIVLSLRYEFTLAVYLSVSLSLSLPPPSLSLSHSLLSCCRFDSTAMYNFMSESKLLPGYRWQTCLDHDQCQFNVPPDLCYH